jgi:hypothetical protein
MSTCANGLRAERSALVFAIKFENYARLVG